MLRWIKRKGKIDESTEDFKHIRTRKDIIKDDAGFTLVEVMIAVAIFSLMVAPLMSGFVVSNRINSKGRQTEQALTIAQDLMEGIKSFGLEELAKQINTDSITIVSNGSDTTAVSGTDKSVTPSYASSVFDSNTYKGSVPVNYTYISDEDTDGDGVKDVKSDTDYVYLAQYEYVLDDILMGSQYFDAYIVIEQSDEETYLASQTSQYKTYFASVLLNSMKYYEVTIDVYLSDGVDGSVNENGHRATYTGTIFDNA